MINQINNFQYCDKTLPKQAFGKQTFDKKVQTNQSLTTTDEKKSKSFGVKLAATTLGIGFGLFAIFKGLPFSKGRINNLIMLLGKKSEKMAIKEKQTYTKVVAIKTLNKTKSFVNLYKSAINFTSVKDAVFKKITDRIPLIGNGCQKITDFFENISVKTVKKSYGSTNKQFNKLYKSFYDANVKLSDSNVKSIEKQLQNLTKTVNKSFNSDVTSSRLNSQRDLFNGISDKVWENSFKSSKKFLSSRGSYTNCMAEQMSVSQRNRILLNANKLRASISDSPKENLELIKEIVNNINCLLDPLSNKTINAMKKIESSMKTYAKSNYSVENKKILLKNIKNLNEQVPDNKLKKIFDKSLNSVSTTKEGALQNLLSTYKKILPEKEYLKLEKASQKTLNSLNKSVNLETNKLFEKMRDLEIGSAPTDILSLLATIGTVGLGLSKAKNKDERISVALKYGIPALGAITVSLICTTSLVSAGPSLAIGMISGLLINKVGEFTDKIRKTISETNQNINKIKS